MGILGNKNAVDDLIIKTGL